MMRAPCDHSSVIGKSTEGEGKTAAGTVKILTENGLLPIMKNHFYKGIVV
jgi:hypothetical protein